MIHIRVVREDGVCAVPPCRLVAVEGTITTAQGTWTDQDFLPGDEPFISGDVTAVGGTRFFVHYPGH